MKDRIISLISVVMLIAMLMPAGTSVVMAEEGNNQAANNETSLVADFEFNIPECPLCEGITFADQSTGGTGNYSHDWDFGDGNYGTEQNPKHYYDSLGAYNVTLTVTDGAGNTAHRTETVTVDSTTKAIELDSGTRLTGLVAPPSAWPTTWTPLDTDPDEGGGKDHRDVFDADGDGYALYYAVDSDYIYLRMETLSTPGWPSTDPSGEARYKWWFDTQGTAASVHGTTADNAEFLLILEDLVDNSSNLTTSRDLLGELTFMDDLNNDGFMARWDSSKPPNYTINNAQTDPAGPSPWWRRVLEATGTPGVGGPQEVMGSDIGYRIDNSTTGGNFVDMYVSRAVLGNPSSLCLIWATDRHNPNLDQAPNLDRPELPSCIMLGKDYGDAPDPDYPTWLTNGGAGHTLSELYLGSSIDVELDGIPSLDASGDDSSNYDDEDGVDFTTALMIDETASVTVTASSDGGYLDAWVDFNGDGDWAEANEQIFNNEPLNEGLNNLNFTVPGSAQAGDTFARFRCSSAGGLSYVGLADDGEVEDYMVTLTGRALEITAASDSKIYDGTPLTNDGYSITAGSLAAGHTLDSVTVTGSQTDVGSSPNVPSAAVIKDGAIDVTGNYDITYVNGTLTVTKRPLQITAASDSKIYDGTPLTNDGYSITAGSLAAGDTLDSVVVTGSQTDVGSSPNVPSAAVIKDGAIDVTGNYDITYVNGTLTVTKRALQITAASNSKIYDGTPLTDSGYSITAGSLAAGDTLDSVVVTGSQTDVGSSPNVPSAAVIKDGAIDVTGNYDITYVNGTLTVTAPPTPGPYSCSCCYECGLTVDWEGCITTKPLYCSNDKLAVDLLGPSLDLSHNLFLERGTHAPVVYTTTHYLILVREVKETPATPENMEAIVVFNITPADATFDKDIFLTLGVPELPSNVLNVTMAYYDDINGAWELMESEAGGPSGVAELTLSTPINHFSIYGVLAELEATPEQPAHLVASGLNIEPTVEKLSVFVTKTGESATITANVANDGGQGDTYTVELKLNGETVDTEIVTLAAGQSKQVSFTVSELDNGQYDVEVAGLSGEFTTSRTITWWLILVIIVAVGLLIWGIVWGTRRRRKAQQEA